MSDLPRTLGELRAAGYESRSVRDEIRANVIGRLAGGDELFPGIRGYDDTVIPQVVNALLSRHHFILLGLRGQAKSRMLRELAELLDERIPCVAGSEVNDDPFRPISRAARERIDEQGDETPIAWVSRDSRYVEKLATPDVTIADIIGDLDPIKAARGGHLLSDELTIHYGLLPRANRGIFAINELPDLAGKIQVALFNVMQEGDVQVKGYPVRLPLDVLLVFSANPEDYTARGKIITPLKDRIGSEIQTHYPTELGHGVAITSQESWLERHDAAGAAGPAAGIEVRPPRFIRELIERIAFEAREDSRVDQRSGVSQRLPITVLENAVSNAEQRAIRLDERPATVRVADIYSALPSITGKLELEYEGELQGAGRIAQELIARACAATFDAYFEEDDAAPVVEYFDGGGALQIAPSARGEALLRGLETVPGLVGLVEASEIGNGEASGSELEGELIAGCELVLEGLHAKRKIARTEAGGYSRRPRPRPPPGSGGLGGLPGGLSV